MGFVKIDVNYLRLTLVLKSMLTISTYLQKCHHALLNIDFLKNQ